MKLALRPAATADLRAAYHYYEDIRPGLSEELAQELNGVFGRLEAFPRSAPAVGGFPVRRATLRRFPFAVFYLLSDEDRIEVLRAIHTSRSPEARPRG